MKKIAAVESRLLLFSKQTQVLAVMNSVHVSVTSTQAITQDIEDFISSILAYHGRMFSFEGDRQHNNSSRFSACGAPVHV